MARDDPAVPHSISACLQEGSTSGTSELQDLFLFPAASEPNGLL